MRPLSPLTVSSPLGVGSRVGILYNLCITVGYDGSEWYGKITGVMGSSDPDRTEDGTLLYSFKFNAAGNFVIQFGDAGDEQISSATSFNVYSEYYGGSRVAQWNDTTLQYEFDDQLIATDLIDKYNNGITEVCIFVSIEEGTALYYTYDTILTGTA